MNCKKVHTILVVEDDKLLLDSLVHHLEAVFEVIAVGSGQAAIQEIESGHKIDLLLTDFDLRESLDGLDVARAAKKRHPSIPILLLTGSGQGLPRVQELLSLPGTILMAKPFHLDELDRAIGAFFDAGYGSATISADDPL